MNIFITGYRGFVGSHLVSRLLAEGHTVTCHGRNARLPGNMGKFGVVYHIAGVLGSRKARIIDYYAAHVGLTHELLKRMNEHQHFVYMSSAWVTCPEKPYEETKQLGERVVIRSGIGYTIMRPGFIYGPGDFHHLPLFKWINRLGRFFPIVGDGRNLVCPTYIGDVVDALVAAPRNGEPIVPIAGRPVAMEEFIGCIAKALGRPTPFLHIPSLIKADFFTKERVFDSTWESTELERGLETTVEWYREHGYL